jgi:hypothetical protein
MATYRPLELRLTSSDKRITRPRVWGVRVLMFIVVLGQLSDPSVSGPYEAAGGLIAVVLFYWGLLAVLSTSPAEDGSNDLSDKS